MYPARAAFLHEDEGRLFLWEHRNHERLRDWSIPIPLEKLAGYLRDSLGMWLISPLHEPDPVEDLETGAIKTLKPHYHVMYFHGAPITPKAGRSIFSWTWIVTPHKAGSFRSVLCAI